MVAIGNSVLTIIWNLISGPAARYHDLGPDFCHSRHGRQRRERGLIRRLGQLTGKTVTLQPGPGEQPAA
jgi:transposase